MRTVLSTRIAFSSVRVLVAGASLLFAAASQAGVITNIATDYSTTQGGNGYSYGSLQYTFGGVPDDSTFTTSHMPATASATGYFGNYDSGCCGTSYPQIQAPITANDQFDQLLFHGVTNPSDGSSNPVGGSGLPYDTTVAAALRWTSTYTGEVQISGDFRAYNFCCGESQAPYVFVNGVAVIGNQGSSADTNLSVPISNTSRSTTVGPFAGESAAGFDSATNQGGVSYGPDHTYSFDIFLHAGDTVDWVSDPRLGFYGDLTLISGEIIALPEPSSIVALVGLCGMGLFMFARRRRKN
jgi:hypothetical protein